MRLGLLTALAVSLAACAPVIVGRTPEPAAPGTVDVTVATGYPLSLTTTPACENPDFVCNEGFVPADYNPLGSPLSIMVAQGLGGETEINYLLGVGKIAVFLFPLLRVGGKTLVYDDSVKLAVDYGLFGGGTNAGLDAGLLASLPLEGAELYSALRGFGSYFYSDDYYEGQVNVSGAFTLGVEADVSIAKGVFAELTFATTGYNGVDLHRFAEAPLFEKVPVEVQQIGFSILPAVGIRF